MVDLWQINRVKELENKSMWHEAAQGWMNLGMQDEANACITIAYAIDDGDAYREEVDNTLGPEPELTPSSINEYRKWHEGLREIYNKHFKKITYDN